MYFQGAAPRTSLNTAEQFTWRIGTNTETGFNTKRQTDNKQIDRETERACIRHTNTLQIVRTRDEKNTDRLQDEITQTTRDSCVYSPGVRMFSTSKGCKLPPRSVVSCVLILRGCEIVLSAQRQKERGCKGGL